MERLWSARFIDPLSDTESFHLNDNNQIYEIGQPLSCTDLLPDYQFTGIYYLSPDIVRLLLSDHNKFFHQSSTDILNHFCRFKTINAVPWAGEWIEIDTPSDITVSLNQRLSLSRLINQTCNDFVFRLYLIIFVLVDKYFQIFTLFA